jgi:HEAT repeat protein
MLIALFAATSLPCAAQGARTFARPEVADSSPARIMSGLDGTTSQEAIREVLRQKHQAYGVAKRRELLDSLTARAITRPAPAAFSALMMIRESGDPDPMLEGLPNPDALDRLIQVYKQAADSGTRQIALMVLTDQVDPSRSLPTLRAAATKNGGDAYTAVMNLEKLAYSSSPVVSTADRDKAKDVLRELSERKLVVNGPAVSLICAAVSQKKLPTKYDCRGSM